MQTHTLDYLIIGQGLAGSILAWQLLHAGKQVLVIDDGHRSSSSKVAAGLVNPLAGMRFNCAPRTTQWLASAHAFYDTLGGIYGQAYYHAVDMQRLFRSPEQVRFFERQQQNPGSAEYLGERLGSEQIDPGIQAPHGGFLQYRTGYLDMPQILADLRHWLIGQNAYREQAIDYTQIELIDQQVAIGDVQATQLVFCEGYRMLHNPWFDKLPLQPDKGEFLLLHSERRLCEHIVNGAHWIIPLADGGYRFGATHEHKDITTGPTAQAREKLEAGLAGLFEQTADVQIVAQDAGVRPATSDRQPFIGTHPRHASLHLFNGFGARGALTIPWFAEQFAAHLLRGAPLPPEADIARYRESL